MVELASGAVRARVSLSLPSLRDVARISPELVLVGDALVDLERGRVQRMLGATRAAVADDGTLFVARGTEVVHERVDGTELGRFDVGAPVGAIATFDESRSLVLAVGTELRTVYADSGTEQLRVEMGRVVELLLTDGTLVIAVRPGDEPMLFDAAYAEVRPIAIAGVPRSVVPHSVALRSPLGAAAFVGVGEPIEQRRLGIGNEEPLAYRTSRGFPIRVGTTPWGYVVHDEVVGGPGGTSLPLPLGRTLGDRMVTAIALDEHRALLATEGAVHVLCGPRS